MAYDNTNSGALFKNEKKSKENHPDYTGQINVGGHDFWLSAWIKKSSKGQTFMSLSVKAKDQNQYPNPQPKSQPANNTDDVPF